MKAYTDLEQSKKLAEILQPESADMCFNDNEPCWSLAALLDQLDDIVVDEDWNEYKLEIIKEGVQYYIVYEGMLDAACYETSLFDDLVDAAVEMLIKLKKNNLI